MLKSLRLENTQSQGVFIGSSTYVTIRQCALKDVAQDGIQINGSSGVLIEKCSITAPGGDGIHVHLSDGCVAVKNKIKNAGVEGIEADGDMHTFEANTIDGTGGAGILLGDGAAGCSNVLVLENKVTATFSYAIWCRPDSRDCTILGNDLIEPGSDGIYVTGGSDGHLIAKNALRDGHDLGITLESDWCSLLQNTITEPAADGIFIGTTCSGALVSKNKVTKSGGNGVGVQGTGNAFVQNKASKSAAYDLDDDTLPGDNVYINNTFPTIAP
ncbi:MAG: right-handed parallel beta-helix repeat-containing protein [Planctomycetes bacterium]|nr:right-handed parallel beta-helix repeat-containing protein [Planctomycetota bacterium]